MYTKLLVENILKHPLEFKWSVQGLGLLRIYLSQEIRLHVWDSRLKVPEVSAMHTHPWDLESLVIAGKYKQYRYVEKMYPSQLMETFKFATIKCGEEACTMEAPQEIELSENAIETYLQGMTYSQHKDEIHLSMPEDGTVTIIKRTFHKDRDHAKVYWRGKGGWVDAKPREATKEEILSVTSYSLKAWF